MCQRYVVYLCRVCSRAASGVVCQYISIHQLSGGASWPYLLYISHLHNPQVPKQGVYYAPGLLSSSGERKGESDCGLYGIEPVFSGHRLQDGNRKDNPSGVGDPEIRLRSRIRHNECLPALRHAGASTREMLLILGPDGTVYRPRCAFFGLKPIPRLWTKVTRVVLWIFRENGIVCTIYIDDGLDLATTELEAFLDLIFMVQTMLYLGYSISWKKI